ncbi:hypothetical protein SEMRO_2817_G337790.1 [Seminavis robusta]|uniref:Uncharacterized protein n=1 Tax=Seminavis robusta TaxID=568900 RepID=A0A9N8F080_9STRA|nr:hypothetical protein SEMRO_2817_G337790.1 [Seminavis robusta]|eukprot:Sro2817_g337790.1 n/a (196) ;mRNA; f:8015-8602
MLDLPQQLFDSSCFCGQTPKRDEFKVDPNIPYSYPRYKKSREQLIAEKREQQSAFLNTLVGAIQGGNNNSGQSTSSNGGTDGSNPLRRVVRIQSKRGNYSVDIPATISNEIKLASLYNEGATKRDVRGPLYNSLNYQQKAGVRSGDTHAYKFQWVSNINPDDVLYMFPSKNDFEETSTQTLYDLLPQDPERKKGM